jgi:hypothetical protein
MGKGVTLTIDELASLRDLLNELNLDEIWLKKRTVNLIWQYALFLVRIWIIFIFVFIIFFSEWTYISAYPEK